MVEHLTNLLDEAEVVPAVNQIELHPYFQQPGVQAFNAGHGIVTQAWSPIGGITFYRQSEHTSTLEDPAIVKIAESHCKSPAQVMLRWHLQEGRSVIPKSTKPHRIAENFDVFDFELSGDELDAIDGLNTGVRGGPEPDAVTLEAFGPWIWNRYWVRVTALPSGRDGERSSLTSSTSQSPVSAWN